MSDPQVMTGPPVVRLINYFKDPFDSAIAAARTCYAPRVIGAEELTEQQRESIGRTTFVGGHHTVFQHPHFEFGLERISRQFVWSCLHSFPFYNSEQSSQRYVRLDEVRAFVPPLAAPARAVYEAAIIRAWDYYRQLSELLKKDTFSILQDLRYLTARSSEARRKKVAREAEKKAIEIARYVIPIAAYTSMVYTISGIVLHRLRRMMHSGDAPYEAAQVITQMVDCVNAVDPQFFQKIGEAPLPPEALPEISFPVMRADASKFNRAFDAKLSGYISRLIDYSPHAEELVAEALRAVIGADEIQLPTAEALDRVMNPARNSYRLDTLNLSAHAPIMRVLHHPAYTFMKKISHTADSQDQRHRMVPASRPLMTMTDTEEPDFITPRLIAANPQARSIYEEAMAMAWHTKRQLVEMGVPVEWAIYILPNAKALRFIESGSFLNLLHKWTMRTCLNAQEEIFHASMDELDQVRAVHPRLARFVGPNCVLRNGLVAPRCTEGDHFCGLPVWRSFPNIIRPL